MHPDPFVDNIRYVPKRCIRIRVLSTETERLLADMPRLHLPDWKVRLKSKAKATITSTFVDPEPSPSSGGRAVKRMPLTCWV